MGHLKIALLLLAHAGIIGIACNKKDLNINPPTATEKSYFTSETEFRTAVIGVYAGLTDLYSCANSAGAGNNAGFHI